MKLFFWKIVFLFMVVPLGATYPLSYYQSSPWGEKIAPLLLEKGRATYPLWLLKTWGKEPQAFEALYYKGALYSFSRIELLAGGEEKRRTHYTGGSGEERVFNAQGNLLSESHQSDGMPPQTFYFDYTQQGLLRGYESHGGKKELTFRQEGSLREIRDETQRWRLEDKSILLNSPSVLREWHWGKEKESSQTFSRTGKVLQTKERIPLPQGEWLWVRQEPPHEIRSRYSSLGWILQEEIWEDSDLVTRQNWRYNDLGQVLSYGRETKTQKQETLYKWQEEELVAQSLFEGGREIQTTTFSKEGRTHERFSQTGESLGIFEIANTEEW